MTTKYDIGDVLYYRDNINLTLIQSIVVDNIRIDRNNIFYAASNNYYVSEKDASSDLDKVYKETIDYLEKSTQVIIDRIKENYERLKSQQDNEGVCHEDE